MVTATISQNRSIGRVTVSSANRTTVADPTFRPKPNVALAELTDTIISDVVQEGDVLTFDSVTGKFINSQLVDAQVSLKAVNGGSF